MGNELILFEKDNYDMLTKAAATLAKSSVIPYALRGKTPEIFSILLMGAEMGFAPMQALRSFHVIQGTPCMSSAAMLALVRAKLPKVKITITLDEKNLVAVASGSRDGCDPYVATWDMAKAKQMQIAGRDQYIKQPMNMLKWRAVCEMLRVVAPDVILGIYGIEETKDMEGNTVNFVENENEELEKDFPIPLEEKEIGPDYRFQNGKFRGQQCKEICLADAQDYEATLKKRAEKSPLKTWENEVLTIIADWSANYETYQDIMAEHEEQDEAKA